MLQLAGLTVVSVVADGASSNCIFFACIKSCSIRNLELPTKHQIFVGKVIMYT